MQPSNAEWNGTFGNLKPVQGPVAGGIKIASRRERLGVVGLAEVAGSSPRETEIIFSPSAEPGRHFFFVDEKLFVTLAPPWPGTQVGGLVAMYGKPYEAAFPHWLVAVTGSEHRARVMAEVLYWFELAFSDARRQDCVGPSNVTIRQRARARVYEQNGLQWLAISIRKLAARTMLSSTTAQDALRWAESAGLIAILRNGKSTLRIRPNGRRLAEAYYNVTADEVAREFLDDTNHITEWSGSETQARACHRAQGVTVHNTFIAMLDGNHFAARLLSQIVFHFIDRNGKCSANISINGHLWWETTHQRFAKELGANAKQVQRGLDVLVAANLLHKLIRPSPRYRPEDARWLTHVRPNVEALVVGIQSVVAANANT